VRREQIRKIIAKASRTIDVCGWIHNGWSFRFITFILQNASPKERHLKAIANWMTSDARYRIND
jgi:hypothetical protein